MLIANQEGERLPPCLRGSRANSRWNVGLCSSGGTGALEVESSYGAFVKVVFSGWLMTVRETSA